MQLLFQLCSVMMAFADVDKNYIGSNLKFSDCFKQLVKFKYPK